VSAQTDRDALDTLVRRVQQTIKDWPEVPADLRSALDAGALASNVGIDVTPALAQLQAAWAEAQPPVAASEPEPEAAPDAAPASEASTTDEA
jgi:hypothetical protein